MLMSDEDPAQEHWPVYKGASFDLWNPDTASAMRGQIQMWW